MDNITEKSEEKIIQRLKLAVEDFPDFPKPGILFKDVMPILKDPNLVSQVCILVAKKVSSRKPDIVAGLEARGFLFGPLIAGVLGVPFVPIRKVGKLPGPVVSVEYEKEYGKDIVQLQENCFPTGSKILIFDDLLATGGTLAAACKLIEKSGGKVLQCFCLLELVFLNGREKLLSNGIPFDSLICY